LKHLIPVLLSMLLLLADTSTASYGQTITLRDNGVISGYAAVPNGFRCNVEIPDMPTAFCAGPGERVYHKQINTTQSPVDPQQFFRLVSRIYG
jgi:hypothetical protein